MTRTRLWQQAIDSFRHQRAIHAVHSTCRYNGTGAVIVTKPPPPSNCDAGIGLRLLHVTEIAATKPHLGFLEVHAENYMAETGALDRLLELRRDYPVSIHGVALSLGSAEELDRAHLTRFKMLIAQVEPVLVSEHLAWSAIGGAYLNDLLPLP